MDRLFCLACKAEQEIQRRVVHKENKRKVHIPRDDTVVPSTTRRTMTTTSVVVRTTSPPPCDTSPTRVPTSSELIIRGNDEGTNLPPPHEYDECLVHLKELCDQLPTTLITPAILEDYVHDLTSPCDQTILSEPIELNIDAKEPCESGNNSNLDQIRLKIIVPMFNPFNMTSNLVDGSSMLGWFNDKHCQSFDMNKSFTYMCKVSCNIFMPLTSCDNILALYFTTSEGSLV